MLTLAHFHQSEYQQPEQQYHNRRTEKSPLLANGAEDKVGSLFRHKVILSLRSFKVALSEESARADCDF